MISTKTTVGIRQFFEYNIKPTWDLFRQGEIGFLIGAIGEEITDRNPYFWYREKRKKDRVVKRHVRGHEMWIDLYDRGLSRHLFIRGIHEAKATEVYVSELAKMQEETDKGITVLDIGGNIGYYVLEEARTLDDNDSIITFEPDSNNRELLRRNVEINGYSGMVEISPKAIDSVSGKRTFYRSSHSNWNRIKHGDDEKSDGIIDEYVVTTTSIDGFLEESDIDAEEVTVVRMDLEGHEIHVLKGMGEVLSTAGPTMLFIEFHPRSVDRTEYEEAISKIEDAGFDIRFVEKEFETLQIDSYEEIRSLQEPYIRMIVKK